MRLKDIVPAHRELLRKLTAQISSRLETEFTEMADPAGPSVGVELRERGKRSVLELPAALLLEAGQNLAVREKIRLRIKARRDRMLVHPDPTPLPRRFAAMPMPSASPFARGPGSGRPRR